MNRATISVECAHSAHGECRFEDCACICHAVSGDSLATLDERDTYKAGFQAALAWLSRRHRKDVLSDAPLDVRCSAQYGFDLEAMRAARRRLKP